MNNCLICILDILGTKGIWTEKNIDTYFSVISEVESKLNAAKSHFETNFSLSKLEFDYATFSDTLVITLVHSEEHDYFFDQLIGGFSQLILGIFQMYFADSFFVRGAISFGKIAKKGKHFIGPAVDDAAEYFELPDLIGICLTPKATIATQYSIGWNLKFFNKKIDSYLIKYNTPLKNNKSMELFQIDWPKHFKTEGDTMNALSRLSQFLATRNIPITAASKFQNSIDFFNYSISSSF